MPTRLPPNARRHLLLRAPRRRHSYPAWANFSASTAVPRRRRLGSDLPARPVTCDRRPHHHSVARRPEPFFRSFALRSSAHGAGYLKVTVDDGLALVIVDGVPRGPTPLVVGLSGGTHTVPTPSLDGPPPPRVAMRLTTQPRRYRDVVISIQSFPGFHAVATGREVRPELALEVCSPASSVHPVSLPISVRPGARLLDQTPER